jgi:site-specific recombinase XerD
VTDLKLRDLLNPPSGAERSWYQQRGRTFERVAAAAEFLEGAGDSAGGEQLRQASPHWLRHTFAKAALLTGQDIRHFAAWLGHRDLGTIMVYTEQDALDQIRAWEAEQAGLVEQIGLCDT